MKVLENNKYSKTHKTHPVRLPKGVGRGCWSSRLGGVNFGFWSHLGCSGQNAIIFSRKGLV